MLMILPPPASRISRPAAWPHSSAPVTLTASTRAKTSAGKSRNGASVAMPALFTSTSTRRQRAATAANAASTLARSATSSTIAHAVVAMGSIARATFSAAATSRSASTTAQPSSCSRRAIAAPIPRPAPVTTATREAGEVMPRI